MRAITFVIILFIAIIALSWFTLNYLQTSSQDMLLHVHLIETEVRDEKWPEAQRHVKDTFSRWSKIEKMWAMILDHRETDEIELALARLKSFAEIKDQGEALAELSALQFLLEHIPEKERLLLHNVF